MNIWARIVLLTGIAAGPPLADDLHERYVLWDAKSRMSGVSNKVVSCTFSTRIGRDAAFRQCSAGVNKS